MDMQADKQSEKEVSLPPRSWRSREMLKMLAFTVIGALLGLAYNRFVGCRTGACPITANPYISTAYGAAMGFFVSGGLR